MDKDSRFSVSAETYLDKHNVLTYLEDAVLQLLNHQEDNPNVSPAKFFSDYFNSVKVGNHTLFREYAFINSTPHNRSSFVKTFWKCYQNIGRKGDLLGIREYHSLLCILCLDFPFTPVQKTARIILMDDAMDCLISFPDFLYAFQVQFCFNEFLSSCAEVYKDLVKNPLNPPGTVVVPTSEKLAAAPSPRSSEGGPPCIRHEGVDSMQFYRLLVPVCEKLMPNALPQSLLKDILSSATRVTFYGFLMALSKSNALNKWIGKLPNKEKLWEPPEKPAVTMVPSVTSTPPVTVTTVTTPSSPVTGISLVTSTQSLSNMDSTSARSRLTPRVSKELKKQAAALTSTRSLTNTMKRVCNMGRSDTDDTDTDDDDDSSTN